MLHRLQPPCAVRLATLAVDGAEKADDRQVTGALSASVLLLGLAETVEQGITPSIQVLQGWAGPDALATIRGQLGLETIASWADNSTSPVATARMASRWPGRCCGGE